MEAGSQRSMEMGDVLRASKIASPPSACDLAFDRSADASRPPNNGIAAVGQGDPRICFSLCKTMADELLGKKQIQSRCDFDVVLIPRYN